jgi:aldehyde:ferredoxin oxidoreductase
MAEITKICRNCLRELPISSFYKHAKMADGHFNKCKDCIIAAASSYRSNNLETVREYDRERNSLPHRALARASNLVLWRSENREKNLAHKAVARAIEKGTIVRPDNCSRCFVICVPHAHHFDYDKPLEVIWLCASCHGLEHMI